MPLRFKPNQPEVIAKVNEINFKLGMLPETAKTDSTEVIWNKT